MAIQIVMDRTGDSRHPSDRNDAQALAKAERRFYELTGRLHRRDPDRSGSGLSDPIVRPECGRDCVLSEAGRRLEADGMSRHKPPRPSERSRMRAVGALFVRLGAERTPEGRSLQLLRAWLSPAQRAQFAERGYFEVIGGETGKRYRIYRAPWRTSARSMTEAARGSDCASERWASCRSETSCSPRRSRWRAAPLRWPEDSS